MDKIRFATICSPGKSVCKCILAHIDGCVLNWKLSRSNAYKILYYSVNKNLANRYQGRLQIILVILKSCEFRSSFMNYLLPNRAVLHQGGIFLIEKHLKSADFHQAALSSHDSLKTTLCVFMFVGEAGDLSSFNGGC